MYMMFEFVRKVNLLHTSFISLHLLFTVDLERQVKELRNNAVGTYIAQRFFAVTTLTGLICTTLAHYNICTV